jgi:asparagine synthase (glutamine-hydrolysing)
VCGVAGFVDLDGEMTRPARLSVARCMIAALRHRGPDDEGFWQDPEGGAVLGHCRLAIVDLTATGHQPMASESGRYVIAFNGEIYGFRELSRVLVQKGHVFHGTSDTEVLLAAVEEWGVLGALPRLSGMFAFALVDRTGRRLYLVRDRLGEKPMYYGISGDVFFFGSDPWAFRAHPSFEARVDEEALDLYTYLGYVPSPGSMYQGVYKVGAGSVVCVDLDDPRKTSEASYWSPSWALESGDIAPFGGDLVDAVDALEAALRTAVRTRLVSDVPVGALLSGGVDSSLVVALMQAEASKTVQTFAVTVDDDRHDERRYAADMASWLGTEHQELHVEPGSLIEAVNDLTLLCSEPIGDTAMIPTFLVARLARTKVKVVLTGEGGDELFGGYDRYWVAARLCPLLTAVPRNLSSRLGPFIARFAAQNGPGYLGRLRAGADLLSQPGFDAFYFRLVRHWDGVSRKYADTHEEPYNGASRMVMGLGGATSSPRGRLSVLRRAQYLDLVNSLPDGLLAKVDHATMATSLEARVPFLDERVVELAFRLPLSYLTKDGEVKRVERELLRRYALPAQASRPKKGFGLPLDRWLRGPLREWAEELLGEKRLRDEGFLDVRRVRDTWESHVAGYRDEQFRIWDILLFEAWLDRLKSPLPDPTDRAPAKAQENVAT